MEKYNSFCVRCNNVNECDYHDESVCLICKILNINGKHIGYNTNIGLTEIRLRMAEKKCFKDMSDLLTKGTYSDEFFYNSECIGGHIFFCPCCYVREHLIEKKNDNLIKKLNDIYYKYIDELKKCLSLKHF